MLIPTRPDASAKNGACFAATNYHQHQQPAALTQAWEGTQYAKIARACVSVEKNTRRLPHVYPLPIPFFTRSRDNILVHVPSNPQFLAHIYRVLIS